jgi:putative Mn2+ efflux pump MntP
MSIAVIILIAFGLSFDTLAVSMTCGMTSHFKINQLIRFASVLAFFQLLMPMLGWSLGSVVSGFFYMWDHWIAFGLLCILGIKMIVSSFHISETKPIVNPHNIKNQAVLGVATSIDALALGLSIALLGVKFGKMCFASLIIGFVTFMVAVLGLRVGKRLGRFLGTKAEFFGGIVLIAIGVKILIEHISEGC